MKGRENLMSHSHKKQACEKNSVGLRSIFSCDTAINVNENRCLYFTDERTTEPLCWEELLYSNQVKRAKERKVRTMAMAHCGREIADTEPVVFHQKNSVQEILKKQKVRFHLTSCQLPTLQSKAKENRTKTNYKPHVKYLISKSKQLKNKKVSYNNRLELKGSGMQSTRGIKKKELGNGMSKLPREHIDSNFGNFRKKWYGNELCLQDEDTTVQKHDSISPENNLPTINNSSSPHKKYVEIPVSVPNPALTDESCSVVSETTDLKCDIISLEKTDKYNETFGEDKARTNKIPHISNNTDESERKSLWESAMHVATRHNDSGKENFRKNQTNIVTGPGCQTPRESCEVRLSSRLTYTPSTPPLVLSGEIIELPRGVSPSKALLNLRQMFCQSIRRETEQLEFDLQELYLKKQLHER